MTDGAAVGRASRPSGGAVAVVVAAALWGTTGTATHFAPGVPAAVFGAVTFGLGGLLLAARSGRSTFRAFTDRRTRRWVLAGAASLTIYAIAFYAALADAGVALGTTVAIGSAPVFAGLVEWATAGRAVTRGWIVATLVSVAGMVVVTLARQEDPSGGDRTALGLGAALLAGLTYATYSWTVGRGMQAGAAVRGDRAVGGAIRARGVDGGVLGAAFGLAAVPLLVLAAATGGEAVGDPANWLVFGWLAVVPTAIGHTLYAVGLRSVTAAIATLLSLVEPVVAAVLAVLVVGEHLGAVGWGGVALVVLGLALLAVLGRGLRRVAEGSVGS